MTLEVMAAEASNAGTKRERLKSARIDHPPIERPQNTRTFSALLGVDAAVQTVPPGVPGILVWQQTSAAEAWRRHDKAVSIGGPKVSRTRSHPLPDSHPSHHACPPTLDHCSHNRQQYPGDRLQGPAGIWTGAPTHTLPLGPLCCALVAAADGWVLLLHSAPPDPQCGHLPTRRRTEPGRWFLTRPLPFCLLRERWRSMMGMRRSPASFPSRRWT